MPTGELDMTQEPSPTLTPLKVAARQQPPLFGDIPALKERERVPRLRDECITTARPRSSPELRHLPLLRVDLSKIPQQPLRCLIWLCPHAAEGRGDG